MSIVIEGVPYVSREDGGCALILEVSENDRNPFIRIQSGDHEAAMNEKVEPRHPELEPLIGRRLRVTIECVDEAEDLGCPICSGGTGLVCSSHFL